MNVRECSCIRVCKQEREPELPQLARGGAAARIAPLLALFSLLNSGIGCRPSDALAPTRRVARVEALLTTHPAWAQVASLDRDIAQFAASAPLSGTVAPPLGPLPSGFAPPPDLPTTLPQQRRERTQAYEDQYLGQLAETLRLRDQTYLTRLGRRLEQEAKLQYQKELAAKQAAIRAERLPQAAVLDRQITALRFRDVAFLTQIKVYQDQALLDAQLQHNELQTQIAALIVQDDALLAPALIAQAAQTALGTRLEDLRAAATRQIAQETQTLAAQRADRVKREQAKLVYEPDPLPSIDTTPLPPVEERETPLVLPPGAQGAAAMRAANSVVQQAAQRQRAAWTTQRDHLISLIRADTQQGVEQLARQQGWTLAPVGTPGAPDITESLKPLLRAQWQQARQE